MSLAKAEGFASARASSALPVAPDLIMRFLDEREENFKEELNQYLLRPSPDREPDIVRAVSRIVEAVRKEGDKAVLRYSRKFDGAKLRPDGIEVSRAEIEGAPSQLAPEILASLQMASERIRIYHTKQLETWAFGKEFDFTDALGIRMGQRPRPMERVGIYVPGGKAAYPSSVLMGAIPAKVAGVKEVIMASPQQDGPFNSWLLIAAKLAGVDRIFRIGGAHAIAALAYGTETIPRVDKIVGPGNAYVTAAKRLVYGAVDIDMIAGPTEVVVLSDGSANPAYIAADMLSQAEHDEAARATFLTTSEWEARAVQDEVVCQLEAIERREIAEKSIETNGAVILTSGIERAIEIINRIAPEHLEILCENPRAALDHITSAGAVFLGSMTPEPLGDYMAGANHILPTGGSARFRSSLGVYDFFKRTSVIEAPARALIELGDDIIRIARLEGLFAHAHAVDIRLKKEEPRNE